MFKKKEKSISKFEIGESKLANDNRFHESKYYFKFQLRVSTFLLNTLKEKTRGILEKTRNRHPDGFYETVERS